VYKLIILSVIMLSFAGCASSLKDPNADTRKTVFVLGTLHGGMFSNPDYSMLDFQKAIITYNPTHILTEVRSGHPGAVAGSIDGGIEQSLVYAIADRLGAEVIAVDWFDDEFIQEYLTETPMNNQAYEEEVRILSEEISHYISVADMVFWNGHKINGLLRRQDEIYEKYGLMATLKRNKRLCENIHNALEKIKSGRILIIFGAAHKYYFDDFLKENANLKLISDMADWYDPEMADRITFDEDINTAAINTLKESKELLKTRLESNFYQPETEKRLEGKYLAIDRAIENFLKLSEENVLSLE